MTIKCPFKNEQCLCQWCKEPCNDGLMCHECIVAGEQKHNCYICTGFEGMYPWGTHSDEVKRIAEKLCECEERSF